MRKSLLLLLASLSLCQNAWSQKENWTFSDRTGIKGVQISFATLPLINKGQVTTFQNHFTSIRNSGDSISTGLYGPRHRINANMQVEVVYAPFRFNSTKILKNLELMAGVSIRQFDQQYITEVISNRQSGSYDTERIYYELSNRSSFFNLKAAVNFPISSGIAGFANLGYGFGLSSGSVFTQSKRYNTTYQWQNYWGGGGSYNPVIVNASGQEEVRYKTSVYHQETLNLGVKIYVSCRMNLNLSYAFHLAQYVDRNSFTSSINEHGFQVGMRFKFNPPEPLTPEEKEKLKDAFW